MPVEIKQLTIRSRVSAPKESVIRHETADDRLEEIKELIIAECIERILRILEREREH